MSGQRSATFRRGDFVVTQAFQIALAQCEVPVFHGSVPAFVTVMGNKSGGEVLVTMAGNEGVVYLDRKDENLALPDRVKISVLEGKTRNPPRVVEFHDFGGLEHNLYVVLLNFTRLREHVIHQLLGTMWEGGFETADTIAEELSLYPKVEAAPSGYRLTYQPYFLDVMEVSLYFRLGVGFVEAAINGTHKYRRRWTDHAWEAVTSEE